MTSEQIGRLRKGLGSTSTSTVQEDMTKLLDEREALLVATKDLRGLAYNALRMIGDSREKVESHVSIVRADAAIAKAESP